MSSSLYTIKQFNFPQEATVKKSVNGPLINTESRLGTSVLNKN